MLFDDVLITALGIVFGSLVIFFFFICFLIFVRRDEVFGKVYSGVPFDTDRLPELQEKELGESLRFEEWRAAQEVIDEPLSVVEVYDFEPLPVVSKVRSRKRKGLRR